MKTRIDVLAGVALAALFQGATNLVQTSRASTRLGSVVTSAIPQQTGTAVLSARWMSMADLLCLACRRETTTCLQSQTINYPVSRVGFEGRA